MPRSISLYVMNFVSLVQDKCLEVDVKYLYIVVMYENSQITVTVLS